MAVAAFLALPEEPDADAKLSDLETRLGNSKAAATLMQRASLK